MQYVAGDTVWYCGQFGHVEYEGLDRGLADHQPDASEPIYALTLLSGPYVGQTSTVYERELRPIVRRASTLQRGAPIGNGASGAQHAESMSWQGHVWHARERNLDALHSSGHPRRREGVLCGQTVARQGHDRLRRWMGMNNRLHAVEVLADGSRVILDEHETPRRAPRKGSEWDFPYRWY